MASGREEESEAVGDCKGIDVIIVASTFVSDAGSSQGRDLHRKEGMRNGRT